jgi:hypothetical protein
VVGVLGRRLVGADRLGDHPGPQAVGPKVLSEVFEQVATPVATGSSRGAWLRGWRLVAIDGFEVDVPDTDAHVAEFGYAGSGDNRSAFVEGAGGGTGGVRHARVPRRAGRGVLGREKTLANPLYQRLNPDELLTADRNFYSFTAWDLATRAGAALVWWAPTGLALPVVKVLPEGTYLAVLINPKIRGARRRAAIPDTADAAADGLDPEDAHLVRVVEYDVAERAGNGAGELIVLLSTILDPAAARADELAAAYPERWEERPGTTSSRPTCADRGRFCARSCPSWCIRKSGRGC